MYFTKINALLGTTTVTSVAAPATTIAVYEKRVSDGHTKSNEKMRTFKHSTSQLFLELRMQSGDARQVIEHWRKTNKQFAELLRGNFEG